LEEDKKHFFVPKKGEKMEVLSSFRDPSGFIFCQEGELYRQVNSVYKDDYDQLINSGLYKDLVNSSLMIPHKEVDLNISAYKVLKPELVEFISYPYEWTFSQLKDAALITLEIQRKALEYRMTLKDASAYNIQFHKGKPILIDTLSFERYIEGKPWVAYRQFCQHFLAPLTLMSYKDIRLGQLLRIYIDGIPIDLTNHLLPFRTRLKPSLFSHIYLHTKGQEYVASELPDVSNFKITLPSIRKLINSLESTIKQLKWTPKSIEGWDRYYYDKSYNPKAFQDKLGIISNYLKDTNPKSVWDLGANDGTFSRLASDKGITTISFDFDYAVVEKNYSHSIANNETHILPLLLDLTNPSPNLGWANQERQSLIKRGKADVLLALALIHHLTIANNVPFNLIANFFSQIGKMLIVEFVPKDSPQSQRLLATRKDVFTDYTMENFESEFSRHFSIKDKRRIIDSDRVIYFMKGKK